jgi:gas vesicle protein
MISQMKNFTVLLKGLLIGWLVGAAVALVYAPRRGEEIRSILREKSLELKDQATEKVEETRSRAEELARVGMERVTELKQQGQATLNEQKVTVQSTVEGVKEGVRTFVEQGQNDLEQEQSDLPVLREEGTLVNFTDETPTA